MSLDALFAQIIDQQRAILDGQKRIEERLERVERRGTEELLDMTALAKVLNKPTRKAVEMWLKRPGGAELNALAIAVGERRRWRRSDVDAWLARGGGDR